MRSQAVKGINNSGDCIQKEGCRIEEDYILLDLGGRRGLFEEVTV